MSSLTDVEKRYLEKILKMEGGSVLDYNDAKFDEFFRRYNVTIHDSKYKTYGTSKANKMRAFWAQEPDTLVGKVISEMLDSYETDCELKNQEVDKSVLEKSRNIAARLSGKAEPAKPDQTVDDFLHHEFTIPNIQKLPLETRAVPIVESRLDEAKKAFNVGAYLSVIFLCGSVLEAVLLSAAQKEPVRFNQAAGSPKNNDDKVKQFHEWSLSQLIDVSSEVGLLKPDVKKFSHGLRYFRNYIHPYEEMNTGFTPDEHTAKLCFQVVKAALASVAGERK
ncbi:MAG: hypothetical protein INF41_05725 [Rhodospirillaceae bacterium]|jgi:hypothetical protein|nr:hypothetical protein [Rhodospirillaceae bacterium]